MRYGGETRVGRKRRGERERKGGFRYQLKLEEDGEEQNGLEENSSTQVGLNRAILLVCYLRPPARSSCWFRYLLCWANDWALTFCCCSNFPLRGAPKPTQAYRTRRPKLHRNCSAPPPPPPFSFHQLRWRLGLRAGQSQSAVVLGFSGEFEWVGYQGRGS